MSRSYRRQMILASQSDQARPFPGIYLTTCRYASAKTNDEIELPESAVRLLVDILANMAEGNAVTLIPVHAELTTKQAADILGVSRPFLIRLLEDGVIPFRKVGTHRRVFFEDVQAYRKQVAEERESALQQLVEEAQSLDMGY
jgi:excisionase family DNA binding protein